MPRPLEWLLRLFLWLAPGLCLVFALLGTIDRDGQTEVIWHPGESSPFFAGFRPSDRVVEGEESVRLIGDPVYASIVPPGEYDTVHVGFMFRSKNQPLMEVGGTVNAERGAIDLRPFHHATLEKLSWPVLEQAGQRLWQSARQAMSIRDWLERPIDRSKVAVYRASVPEVSRVPVEWTAGNGRVLDQVSLRGRHTFFTVSNGRPFHVEALVMDMNRNPGIDPVRMVVSQFGEVIGEASLEDDGVDRATQVALERRTLSVQVSTDPGMIQIELLGNTDIYWRRLQINTPKMTFQLPVHIGDDVGYLDGVRGATWWTNAQQLTLHTVHASATQEVQAGRDRIVLPKEHERVVWKRASQEVMSMYAPKGDVVLVGDGLLSFASDALVDALPRSVPLEGTLSAGVDTVFATYTPVKEMGDGWMYAETTFSLPGLEREEVVNTPTRREQAPVRFVLSLPGIGQRGGEVEIREARFVFTRSPQSWGDVFDRLTSLWK